MKDVLRWLMTGEWRAHPGRALVALLAVVARLVATVARCLTPL